MRGAPIRCRDLCCLVALLGLFAATGCSSHKSGGGGNDASAAGGGGGNGGGGGDGGGGSGGGGSPSPGDGSAPLASCKRGAGYTNENALDLPSFQKGIGWWYDWGHNPDPTVTAALQAGGVEYVPMVWTGPTDDATFDVNTIIKQIPEGAHFLLGFNEPNFGQQANLTPQQAAAAWPMLEQIAKARNLKLVSPALNYCGGNCNETDPFVWMDMFFAACTNCQVDYVAFHWYSCSAGALTTMLSKFEAYGKPVWLTEFSCLDGSADESAAGEATYMKTAIPILEADPKVFRYSWFIGRSTKTETYDLFGDPGKLTALGDTYVGLPGACTF